MVRLDRARRERVSESHGGRQLSGGPFNGNGRQMLSGCRYADPPKTEVAPSPGPAKVNAYTVLVLSSTASPLAAEPTALRAAGREQPGVLVALQVDPSMIETAALP